MNKQKQVFEILIYTLLLIAGLILLIRGVDLGDLISFTLGE